MPELVDIQVFGTVDDGADLDAVMADVDEAIADTPSLEVLDRDGFIGDLSSQITSFVTVIYALLLLSIVIALIGIGNTLSLSINERTRELGLLRAVGMDRAPAAVGRPLGGGAHLGARRAGRASRSGWCSAAPWSRRSRASG